VAAIRRVPVSWTTGPGGAGVSIFYSAFGTDATAALGTFFNAGKAKFNTGVTWAIPSSGDTIDENTGLITGAWTGGTAASISGTSSGAYAAGTGYYINWLTGTIRNGRKFRGRTFMCPIIITSYATDGTIDNSFLTQMQTDATALAAAGVLKVWGRPTTPGGSDGISQTVVAGQVPDKVTSLRTRRS
jgi:hypothetical protein